MVLVKTRYNMETLDRLIFNQRTADVIDKVTTKHITNCNDDFLRKIAETEISLKDEGIFLIEGNEENPFYFKRINDEVTNVIMLDENGNMVFSSVVDINMGEPIAKTFAIYKESFKRKSELEKEQLKEFAKRVARMVFDFYRYTKIVTLVNEENRTTIKRAVITPKKKTKKELEREARELARKRVSVSKEIKTYDYSTAEREGEKRSYERQTEAWNSRGYWKTMKKSGKKVWVRGSVKGDKTGKFKGKDYTI